MKQAKEITKDVLNRSLKKNADEALRLNRALGLPTVYAKEGNLVKEMPDGQIIVLSSLERPQRPTSIDAKISLQEH